MPWKVGGGCPLQCQPFKKNIQQLAACGAQGASLPGRSPGHGWAWEGPKSGDSLKAMMGKDALPSSPTTASPEPNTFPEGMLRDPSHTKWKMNHLCFSTWLDGDLLRNRFVLHQHPAPHRPEATNSRPWGVGRWARRRPGKPGQARLRGQSARLTA